VSWSDVIGGGGVAGKIRDEVAERCDWNPDRRGFISTAAESWLRGEHFVKYQEDSVAKSTVPESEERSLPIHRERFIDSSYQEHYPSSDCSYGNQRSAEFVLPKSSTDLDDRSHQINQDDDRGQQRIVGRRWEKKIDSGTANKIRVDIFRTVFEL